MNKKTILRRLLQLRLLTLMVLVTICCIALAFRQAVIVSYQRQAVAATQLKQHGASLRFETPRFAFLAPIIGRKAYRNVTVVQLSSLDVRDEDLVALADLPHLRQLYLANNAITDKTLSYVSGLSRIRRLSLWRTWISDEGLKKLSRLKQLEALDIHATRVSDKGLETLANHPKLKLLKLGPRITNVGLAHLSDLRELKSLDLTQTWVTPNALPVLDHLPLERLSLPFRHQRLRGKELIYFRDFAHLSQLPGEVIECSEQHLVHLRKLKKLTALTVSGGKLSAKSLEILRACSALKELKITGNLPHTVTKSFPKNLAKLEVCSTSPLRQDIQASQAPDLFNPPAILFYDVWAGHSPPIYRAQQISISHGGTQAAMVDLRHLVDSWRALTRRTRLRHLEMNLARDAAIPFDVIAQLKQLETLALHVKQFTAEDLERLTQLPLQSFAVHVPIVSREVLEKLKEFDVYVIWYPHLMVVQSADRGAGYTMEALGAGRRICELTEPSTAEIRAATSHPDMQGIVLTQLEDDVDLASLSSANRLHTVYLYDSQLHPNQWQQIWKIPHLRTLTVTDCNLSDPDLKHVQQLRKLRQLELRGVLVSDDGIEQISKLSSLNELTLGTRDWEIKGPYASDRGLAALGKLTSLKALTVNNQALEGRAFAKWRNLQQLWRLDLALCDVSDQWVDELLRLTHLKYVDLDGTRLSDASVDTLARLAERGYVQVWTHYLTPEALDKIRVKNP